MAVKNPADGTAFDTDELPDALHGIDNLQDRCKRSLTWNVVLHRLRSHGAFKISELGIPEDLVSRHTVRRTLLELEEQGWLNRRNEGDAIWRMGSLYKTHGNVSPEKIKAAEER